MIVMDVHMNCVDLYILFSLVLFYSYLKASKMSRQVSYEMEKYGNNFLIIKCSQIYIIMDLLQYQFNNQNTMFVPDELDHTGSRFCGQNERQIEHNSELAIFRRKILMVIKKKGTYISVRFDYRNAKHYEIKNKHQAIQKRNPTFLGFWSIWLIWR